MNLSTFMQCYWKCQCRWAEIQHQQHIQGYVLMLVSDKMRRSKASLSWGYREKSHLKDKALLNFEQISPPTGKWEREKFVVNGFTKSVGEIGADCVIPVNVSCE